MAYNILRTDKGSYYVGSTDDINKRLEQHAKGMVKSTKPLLPVKLVYKEYFGEAQEKEYRIKSWKSKKLIESLIRKTMPPSSSPA